MHPSALLHQITKDRIDDAVRDAQRAARTPRARTRAHSQSGPPSSIPLIDEKDHRCE
jgi:hypothetical protein